MEKRRKIRHNNNFSKRFINIYSFKKYMKKVGQSNWKILVKKS